jgi:hypothetical protein
MANMQDILENIVQTNLDMNNSLQVLFHIPLCHTYKNNNGLHIVAAFYDNHAVLECVKGVLQKWNYQDIVNGVIRIEEIIFTCQTADFGQV